MRLRAEITVDLEADDYVQAAEHQRALESLFASVKERYAHAALLIRQRRENTAEPARKPSSRAVAQTGSLASYTDH